MCDFEDINITSSSSREQADEDSRFVEILSDHGMPVMATSHIANELGLGDLITIWHEFCLWKKNVKPALPEEYQLFHTEVKRKTVWVIEEDGAFTIMYPEDY
jgi:hypothetical protein